MSDDFGTFGYMRTPLGFRMPTIECPWLDNRSNVSCIPAGKYDVVWTRSPRFRRGMYILLGTGHRSGIRAHPGNLAGNTEKGLRSHFQGCIGLGTRFGHLRRQRAVLLSAPAVRAFEDHMNREPFTLEIL